MSFIETTMNLISLLIASLACFRISYMLTEEDGPWDLFFKLRRYAKNIPWSPLHCFYCTSIWIAFPIALFMDQWLLSLFAISALAILIYLIHEALEEYGMQVYENKHNS